MSNETQLTPFNSMLKKLFVSIKGDFLLPEHYTQGHQHDWVMLDAGFCICQMCGLDHVCFQGLCPVVSMEHSEQICSISGCIILKTEMKPEWGAMDRVALMEEGDIFRLHNQQNQQNGSRRKSQSTGKKLKEERRKSSPYQQRMNQQKLFLQGSSSFPTKKVMKGNMEMYEFVEMVVREILDSPKTIKCREEEILRDKNRKMACLAKVLREMVTTVSSSSSGCDTADSSLLYPRPNMIVIEAKLSWMCRKCRYYCHTNSSDTNAGQTFNDLYKRTGTLERVIGICVENITQLIKMHGWHRVNRQLQHTTRGKEFVCSMLYLMRMGITFRNQNILQKVEILNELLPMQVFLPSMFNIRAKSITEGENLIKLDIQRMPL
jgi:hypothetical protein